MAGRKDVEKRNKRIYHARIPNHYARNSKKIRRIKVPEFQCITIAQITHATQPMPHMDTANCHYFLFILFYSLTLSQSRSELFLVRKNRASNRFENIIWIKSKWKIGRQIYSMFISKKKSLDWNQTSRLFWIKSFEATEFCVQFRVKLTEHLAL